MVKTKKHRKKKRKTTRKFKKMTCSPKKKEFSFTCYTKNALLKLKEIWNKRHPTSNITSIYPKEIWKNLKNLMNNTCKKESCWLKHQCIKNDINFNDMNKMFAPTSPFEWKKNRYEWLSTIDIQDAMKQWEDYDKSFRFLGASPLDYDSKIYDNQCVWNDLCNFNLENEINDGVKKIGVVFNLDKHDKDGSHWVGVYIDLNKKHIYFFDSYGDPPPSRIMKFCRDVKKQAKKLNLKYKIIVNKKRHQYKDGQCGMYSMYFIISLLKGISFNALNKSVIKDDKMSRFRKKYFNIPD
jgi:hypothetical protein